MYFNSILINYYWTSGPGEKNNLPTLVNPTKSFIFIKHILIHCSNKSTIIIVIALVILWICTESKDCYLKSKGQEIFDCNTSKYKWSLQSIALVYLKLQMITKLWYKQPTDCTYNHETPLSSPWAAVINKHMPFW